MERQPPAAFWDHVAQPAPDILYHYTSLETLRRIIESDSLYASDALYLNDSKEFVHAVDAIVTRINILLNDTVLDGESKIALAHLGTLLTKGQMIPAHVTSFSEKCDDLSQWRGYTPAGQGVCIGFDVPSLKSAVKDLKE